MIAARGVDDTPEQLRAIVAQAVACRMPDELLQLIGQHVDLLRPQLRNAVVYALKSPLECDSVESLASVAGLSSRAVRREMAQVGLAGPREWLAVARVLRAAWELRDPAIRIRHLVAIMGYSSEDPLASDVALVTGGTPSELRLLSVTDLVTMVAHRLAPNSSAHSTVTFEPPLRKNSRLA
jgi:AraC-like DNA-binding protein